MRITQAQRLEIIEDFIEIFQIRFGPQWQNHLTSPLRPSPIKEIAKNHRVSVNQIRKIRMELFTLGQMMSVLNTLVQPIVDEPLYTFP